LVVRIDGDDEIGLAGEDYRIRVIERLRELGFNAVGAESLVFDKDESHRAAFKLGAIVRELVCRKPASGVRCQLGVEWQLLDVAKDAVVYRVTTRSAVFDTPRGQIRTVGLRLLIGSLESVARRPRFRAFLAEDGSPASVSTDPQLPAATFVACGPLAKKMPGAAEQALRAAVVVKSADGFGSGFFITSDGLVLTAAHVLDGSPPKLVLRDGSELDAVPVRVAVRADVALLRPKRPLTQQGCLVPSAKGDPVVGSELYAVGTPTSVSLAFSLTRGIVSGIRDIDGHHILQTDAPVNRGNSGGPMLDEGGEVIAVANAKLAGQAVEGIAFGVPIASALRALAISVGTSTDASLTSGTWEAPNPSRSEEEVVTDAPDPVPSMDPEGDARRAAKAERAERLREEQARDEAEDARDHQRVAARDRATPTYVKVMCWGGMGVGVVGAMAAFGSYLSYDESSTTRSDRDRLTLYNSVGWAAFGVGAASFTAAILLRPPLSDEPAVADSPSSQVVLGPGSVRWEGTF
jgi:S1-C subfamily serine protease